MPRGRFVNRPYEALYCKNYLQASSIATATATVIPTMGLLPAPIIDRERVCKLACKRAWKIAPRALRKAQQSAKHQATSKAQLLERAGSMRPIISTLRGVWNVLETSKSLVI